MIADFLENTPVCSKVEGHQLVKKISEYMASQIIKLLYGRLFYGYSILDVEDFPSGNVTQLLVEISEKLNFDINQPIADFVRYINYFALKFIW